MMKRLFSLLLLAAALVLPAQVRAEQGTSVGTGYAYTPNDGIGPLTVAVRNISVTGELTVSAPDGQTVFRTSVPGTSYEVKAMPISMRPGVTDLLIYVINGSGAFLNELKIIGPENDGRLHLLFGGPEGDQFYNDGSFSHTADMIFPKDGYILVAPNGNETGSHAVIRLGWKDGKYIYYLE